MKIVLCVVAVLLGAWGVMALILGCALPARRAGLSGALKRQIVVGQEPVHFPGTAAGAAPLA